MSSRFKPPGNRTQKLPEDIPIVPSAVDELNPITEELEEHSTRETEPPRQSTAGNRNIFSAGKEKRKEKKEKSCSKSKHPPPAADSSVDLIPMNQLPTSADLESRTSAGKLNAASLKSPHSASTGNIEGSIDQLSLAPGSENGKG